MPAALILTVPQLDTDGQMTGLDEKPGHVIFQPWYLSFIIPVLHFSLLHTECHAQQSALRSKDNYHSSKQ